MEIVCYLANLNIIGSKFSTNCHGQRICNIIPLFVNGFELELVQNESLIINNSPRKLVGQFLESTRIIAKNITEDSLDSLVETVHKITVLLSLATDSQVRFYKWFSPTDSRGCEWAVKGRYSYFRPPLCTINTQHIIQLVERSFNSYEKLEQPRELRAAIDLFVTSEAADLQVELKLATIFILLENLKSSYAECNGYKFVKGSYKKNGKTGTFKRLLKEMFTSVGMSPELTQLIRLRNDIIHSGLSQLDIRSKLEIFSYSKELAGEYLLRLLDYEGEFHLHTTCCMESKILTKHIN